jgi:GAF domain-containing protein
MPESFGTRLRRQRERLNISLSSVAAQTKIHQPLLEELECDAVRHWPSGIFRRAFIRAYAEAIGLRPDDVVREFLTLYPDPIEVVSIGTALASVASTKQRPPTRAGYLAGELTESVLGFLRRLFGQDADHDRDPDIPRTLAASATPGTSEISRTTRTVDVDLLAASHLCMKLSQAEIGSDVSLLLREAGRIVDAIGVIVWAWDPAANGLTPALADGYSDRVLAQLPAVRRDADNATAAAYRSAQTCAVAGGAGATSALAVPVMSPDGCVGVLAVELPSGEEKTGPVRAVVTMIAAQMGRLVEPRRRRREVRYELPDRRSSSAANACA